MGPREQALEAQSLDAIVKEVGRHSYPVALKAARLADALEEALAFWDDAGVAEPNAAHYNRLRAVLTEVDCG